MNERTWRSKVPYPWCSYLPFRRIHCKSKDAIHFLLERVQHGLVVQGQHIEQCNLLRWPSHLSELLSSMEWLHVPFTTPAFEKQKQVNRMRSSQIVLEEGWIWAQPLSSVFCKFKDKVLLLSTHRSIRSIRSCDHCTDPSECFWRGAVP